MLVVVHHEYGSADVLRLERVAMPVPDDDQVLLKVRAASVNPLDWHYLRGTPYLIRLVETGLLRPRVERLGVDLSGEVQAVGKNVTQFKPGDEVFGHRFGAFAEYVRTSEASLALKPASISFEQAAAVPIAALTALQALRDKGELKSGQRVLINGASGGVGSFAVQIAKAYGAEVTGVCSTRNVELVRSLGADHVIDYTREDYTRTARPYDLIVDMVGNYSLSARRRALTAHGTLVMVGSVDTGLWLKPLTGILKSLVLAPFVSQNLRGILADMNQADLNVLRELMESGKVTPLIDRTYSLREVPDAIRYVEEGHSRGKVVIRMDQEPRGAALSVAETSGVAGSIGPELAALAVLAVLFFWPVLPALALNRRFLRQQPGKRSFRWGYYFSLQALLGGVALGLLLEAGAATALVCAAIYALLAWQFAQRKRWAWIALTILSFNPLAWIVNSFYLRKRWSEVAPRASAA
jgi:NADPH:quinone reductase-like Zn-dependent oxidoreductase